MFTKCYFKIVVVLTNLNSRLKLLEKRVRTAEKFVVHA